MDIVAGSVERESDGPWELPDGWAWMAVSDLPMGGSGSVEPFRTPDEPFVLYSVPAFEAKKPEYVCGKQIESNKQFVPSGALLVSKINPRINRIWCVGNHNPNDGKVIASTEWIVIQRHPVVEPDYLRHFLSTERVRQYLAANVSGVGGSLMRVNAATVGAIRVPLAPLAEQRRIVARVDALFAEIAEGEAALEAAREGLDTFRRALLKAAVTGELTKDWREKSPVTETGHDLLARIRSERAAKGQAKGRGKRSPDAPPLDTAALPELPEGWAWGTVDELLEFVTSGSRGWKDYYADAGAIFVRAQNINSGVLDLSDVAYVALPSNAEGLRTRLKVGDVLVTITGANVTVSALVSHEIPEAYVNQHVALLRPLTIDVSDYLLLWLQAEGAGKTQLTKAAYGAGKPGLNLDNIREVLIAIPSPAEAAEILRRVSEALAASADTLAMLDAEAADAARLKQSILKAAFEGRLVPQDPADEPASAMLARLRATQSTARPAKRGRRRRS